MTHKIWTSDYDVAHRAATERFKLAALTPRNGGLVFKLHSTADHLEICRTELRDVGQRTEHYIRGADLVQRYYADPQQLSTEVYARVTPADSTCELVLSRQTELLDSHPEATLTVDFTTAHSVAILEDDGQWSPPGLGPEDQIELVPPQAAAIAVRVTDGSYYGLFVYPGDFSRLRVARRASERVRAEIGIFPESLEKGVIRRSRIRIAAIGAEANKSELAAAYQAFIQSEIPLTT